MAFLDTASARLYVEDKTEILFLPPEVRCLTILGQLYGLASQRCQTAADQLSQAHGGAAGLRLTPTTAAGSIVSLLTTATALEQLPTADALRAAALWDDATAAQLADVRLPLAEGPAAPAPTPRPFGNPPKPGPDTSAPNR